MLIQLVDRLLRTPYLRPSLAVRSLSRSSPQMLESLSGRKALHLFKRSATRIPAYAQFLRDQRVEPSQIENIEDFLRLVPQTTKENYVRRFELAQRCIDGRLPRKGTLDESAGSMGQPTAWIRSVREERPNFHLMRNAMYYLYDLDKRDLNVFINGFLMGAWAGAQRFASTIGPLGILKNSGPDPEKIIRTIRSLGPEAHFIIGGYPPFIKELIDAGLNADGFDWKSHRIDILTGGEGFGEEWRRKVGSHLRPGARIFSMYGAIDLEATIAWENPLTVALRRILEQEESLRRDLFGKEGRPCFMGQFFPLNFHITTAPEAIGYTELQVTVLNLLAAAPKLKYNVGDTGGIIRYRDLETSFSDHGYDLKNLPETSKGFLALPFPFLYVWGRSDGTVSIDGALIGPQDIQKAVHGREAVEQAVRTFKLATELDSEANTRLYVYLELKAGVEPHPEILRKYEEIVLQGLLRENECFRQSYKKNPQRTRPIVQLVPRGQGIFQEDDGLPKYRYLKKN